MKVVRPIHERVRDHVAGLPHAAISKLTGWNEQRTRRLLTGKTRWLAEDMETLAEALGKPVGELYRGARAA